MITGKQAKLARLKLGISQNKVAKDTGLTRPYLSNFELGKYEPTNEFKETLEAYFNKQNIRFGLPINSEVKEITIFGITAGKEGQNTLMFKNCEKVGIGGDYLYFNYTSASTGIEKRACFNLKKISGFASNFKNIRRLD